jgi:hypothetical protein
VDAGLKEVRDAIIELVIIILGVLIAEILFKVMFG